jgi:hypothetical protein
LALDEDGLLLYPIWYNTTTVLLSCLPFNTSGGLLEPSFENLVIWHDTQNPIVRVSAVCPDEDMLVVSVASCAVTNVLVYDHWGSLIQTITLQGQQDIARFGMIKLYIYFSLQAFLWFFYFLSSSTFMSLPFIGDISFLLLFFKHEEPRPSQN